VEQSELLKGLYGSMTKEQLLRTKEQLQAQIKQIEDLISSK